MGSKVFRRVGGLNPGRSVFDLSHEYKTTCDMGQLIPVLCEEVVPGDRWTIGNEMVIRFQPLVAPILHEVNAYIHYFFVPYRLLWDEWEKFITGGEDGEFEVEIPKFHNSSTVYQKGSLWDYLGFPTGVVLPQSQRPLWFPRGAYNFIWSEYYRDENLQRKLWHKPSGRPTEDYNTATTSIQYRNWEKDYFTSSLPFQQRGQAPALPISGFSSAIFDQDIGIKLGTHVNPRFDQRLDILNANQSNLYALQGLQGVSNARINVDKNDLSRNKVDLSDAATFNIADLRLAFQVQKWLERNARAGVRYTEFLRSHFGVSPTDERLDRPEYIGGSKQSIIVSEVLQTSQSTSTSPQANMAGHGLSANRTLCGKYNVKEFGLIMGLLSVMPRTAYQQGINRQWLRRTKYDFYFPEFAHLSEQAIEKMEIYATNNANTNSKIMGFIPRYDEMRVKQSKITGDLREKFDYWHLGRKFSNEPNLNSSFIQCNGKSASMKRIYAVPGEDGLIVNIAHIIKAVRPMPIMANPGYIDHF